MFEDTVQIEGRLRPKPSPQKEDRRATPPTTPPPTPLGPPGPPPRRRRRDPLNTEFIYYSAILRNLAPALSSELDRCRTIPWIRKLFGPEYQPQKFRKKRNKYLCALAITLMNDEVYGMFCCPPPCGALYDIETLPCETFELAEWERDTSWEDTLRGLPNDYFDSTCTIHEEGRCDEQNVFTQRMLDEEFRLFLFLVRPYAALLLTADDKLKVASWLQLLCSVPKEACAGMRSLRNDYMHSLYGCLHDLILLFPFNEVAPTPPLPVPMFISDSRPLDQLFTDPTSYDANEFLKSQPMPDNGAFCYVAISGELVDSNLPDGNLMAAASTSKSSTKASRSTQKGMRHVEVRRSRLETLATSVVKPVHSVKTCQDYRRY